MINRPILLVFAALCSAIDSAGKKSTSSGCKNTPRIEFDLRTEKIVREVSTPTSRNLTKDKGRVLEVKKIMKAGSQERRQPLDCKTLESGGFAVAGKTPKSQRTYQRCMGKPLQVTEMSPSLRQVAVTPRANPKKAPGIPKPSSSKALQNPNNSLRLGLEISAIPRREEIFSIDFSIFDTKGPTSTSTSEKHKKCLELYSVMVRSQQQLADLIRLAKEAIQDNTKLDAFFQRYNSEF